MTGKKAPAQKSKQLYLLSIALKTLVITFR